MSKLPNPSTLVEKSSRSDLRIRQKTLYLLPAEEDVRSTDKGAESEKQTAGNKYVALVSDKRLNQYSPLLGHYCPIKIYRSNPSPLVGEGRISI